MTPEQDSAARARLRRAAHKARNISDPRVRAAAERKVRRASKELLDKLGN